MKPKDIRDLTDDELEQRLNETREAYFNLRFQSASGSLEQTSELKYRRREIARLLTIAHERELS